jgi:CopA family copper-resistance protein
MGNRYITSIKSRQCLVYFVLGIFLSDAAFAKTYHLDIAHQEINLTGKTVQKIAVNDTIPGPVLRFEEGEDVIINVTNHLDEDTSIHWHGFLLLAMMDGVPGINGFDGIKPNQTFTYRFKIRQAGTYWYHSHSNAQEQDGLYGAIVITPKKPDPIKVNADYVVLLSDFSEENASQIMANLKSDSEYYSKARPTIGDFFSNVKKSGFKAAWNNLQDWGEMRMLPTDLSDVTGYSFLINGKNSKQNWTGLFKAGQKVKLRFINAAAMSIFDVRIPGLKMLVVAADGQNIEPVKVDEFRFGIAETYDVIVEP